MKKLNVILVAVAALFSAALSADNYPSRPITLVAVFGPGSASDTICRIIADKLSPLLGQPVIVEDRPGADGALAALYVHHQPADGYTLLMATNSPLSADPFIHKDLNYDPIKDFVPITRVGSFTLMLVVNPKLPIHSVKELADYGKVNPGHLSFASGNTAGIGGGFTVAQWAEISMLHVPYKTTGPALMDVIAGRVSMMFADFTTAIPHVKADTVRPVLPDQDLSRLAKVATWNSCLWGGRFNPVVPIRHAALANQLVKTFSVDLLIAVDGNASTRGSLSIVFRTSDTIAHVSRYSTGGGVSSLMSGTSSGGYSGIGISKLSPH
jgi:tripartite-type tricarboxylate transporter receptor subunit TctC